MRKAKTQFKLRMILLLLFIMLISIILPASAAPNDPGHDILYIEQQGDSELTGTLNISQQLKVANRFYSSYLEILGNGSQPTGSFPQIYASDANTLAINSLTSLYLLKDAGSMVYVGGTGVDINISGALYLGGNNKLYTSASGSASSLNLYWGDKLVCDASQSNCGWATTATGGGDITSVQTENTYLYNGSDTGNVYIRFNESKLNATIDAKVTASGDGNNYTRAIGFNKTGSTLQLNLNRSGMSNLTATFTDTGNCSSTGSCSAITYDTELDNTTIIRTITQFNNASTSDINVSGTYAALDLQIKPDSIDGTELADTITLDANLAINNYNVSFDSGTLFVDSTNNRVGIGTTEPLEELNLYRNVNEGVWITVENYNTGTQALSGIALGSDVSDGGISAYSSGFTGPGGLFGHLAGRASFGSQTGTGINIMAADSTSSADIRFFTNGSFTTNERMRITGSGYIGIGDTTPDALLDIQSSTAANQLRVSYDDSNYGNISVNSGGNMTIKATGHVIIDIS